MNTHEENTQQNKGKAAAHVDGQKVDGEGGTFQFVDHRPETITQRKLQAMARSAARQKQLKAFQAPGDTSDPNSEGIVADTLQAKFAVIQRTALSDAQGALSSFNVTEYQAGRAFDFLVALADAPLAVAMGQLNDHHTKLLLDRLPADRRASPDYARLIVALPVAKAMTYAEWLMSASFDWMRTNAQAGRVLRIFDAMGNNKKGDFLEHLAANDTLRRLLHAASNAQHVASIQPFIQLFGVGEAMTDRQKAICRAIVAGCPPAIVSTIQLCVTQRFDVTVGGVLIADAEYPPIQWEGKGLQRLYPVLESLPAAHVARNAKLRQVGRYDTRSGSAGYYEDTNNEVGFGYNPNRLDDTQVADAGDPLRGVNRFNKVLRHEVGHAVEHQLGWEALHAQEVNRGGWATVGDGNAAAPLMVAASNGYIETLAEPARGWLIAGLGQAMAARNMAQFENDITTTPLLTPHLAGALADDAVRAARLGLNEPWYNAPNGGITLGNKIYQESRTGVWTSYLAAARAQKVSPYQFRSPGEWFAEAYAAYYEPDDRGRGAKLADKNIKMKNWLDHNVHNMATSR